MFFVSTDQALIIDVELAAFGLTAETSTPTAEKPTETRKLTWMAEYKAEDNWLP